MYPILTLDPQPSDLDFLLYRRVRQGGYNYRPVGVMRAGTDREPSWTGGQKLPGTQASLSRAEARSQMAEVLIELERLRKLPCGLGQFCLHLGQAILDEASVDIDPVLFVPGRADDYFGGRPRAIQVRPWHSDLCRKLASRWMQGLRPSVQPELWHATYQDTKYMPWDTTTPLILTVHDLNFLREKSERSIRRRLRRLQDRVDRATLLTSGSEFAAEEIREHVRLDGKRIVVIPHGVCLKLNQIVPQRPKFLGDGPFLFTIGDVTSKKNFHVLVELLVRLPEYRLVIAGSKSNNYGVQLEASVARRKLSARVILPGIVTDEERVWLYQNCDAFLFPSLSEGFGLPIIEALSCGKPVFCSNRTSLPEVGGRLAFLWSTFDPSEMLRVFRGGMESYSADAGYAAKAQQHVEQFSWKRAAQSYLRLYREVLAQLGVRRAA